MVLVGRLLEQPRRLRLVLQHTIALGVADAEAVLRADIALVSRLLVQLRRTRLVLLHTIAIVVADAEDVLRAGRPWRAA
jgi:hypothetical protein